MKSFTTGLTGVAQLAFDLLKIRSCCRSTFSPQEEKGTAVLTRRWKSKRHPPHRRRSTSRNRRSASQPHRPPSDRVIASESSDRFDLMSHSTGAQPDVRPQRDPLHRRQRNGLESLLRHEVHRTRPFIYLEVKGRLMIMSDLEVDGPVIRPPSIACCRTPELERRAKSQGVKDPGNIDVIHLVLQDAGLHGSGAADVSVSPAQRLQELGYRLRTKRNRL